MGASVAHEGQAAKTRIFGEVDCSLVSPKKKKTKKKKTFARAGLACN